MKDETAVKLSVIVPAYNAEKNIERCLNSILSQEYIDIEIIVVDDGSTDDTNVIVNRIIEKDSRVKYIRQNNTGAALARKKGIKMAEGEYIGFVDADDWIEPNMYSRMISQANELKLDLVACDIAFDYANYSVIHSNRIDVNKVYNGKEALKAINFRYAFFPSMCNKIIRRSLFENIRFPQNKLIGEDYSIIIQLLYSDSIRAGVVSEVGYHYMQNLGSTVYRGYCDVHEKAYYNYKHIMYESHKNDDKDIIESYESYMVNEFMGIILAMGSNKKYDNEKAEWIKRFIRKRIFKIITSKYHNTLSKGSAFVMCFSVKMVVAVYNFYRKKVIKFN